MKPILNNDRGVMEVRTHNDGEYAPLRAASGGTDDNSVITKEDLDTALEGAGGREYANCGNDSGRAYNGSQHRLYLNIRRRTD